MLYCLSCVTSALNTLVYCWSCFFFQAEDGIRYLVRSRGLGDVYKRQPRGRDAVVLPPADHLESCPGPIPAALGACPGAALSLIHI